MDLAKRALAGNRGFGVYAVLVLLYGTMFFYRPDFMQMENIFTMLRQASALGVLTLGQLFVISAGDVDLSVVGIMQLSTSIFMLAFLTFGPMGFVAGVFIALAICVLIGLINGILVTKYRVQAFLSTLFMGAVIIGIRRIIFGTTPMGIAPELLTRIVRGERPGWFPNAALIFLVCAVICFIVFNKTAFGRRVMYTGTNRKTAFFSGVNTGHTRMIGFCISAVSALAASMILIGFTGFAAQDVMGIGMEMDALIAAVLGGNILGGGRASVVGAVGGVLVITLVTNAVMLFGLTIQYQYVVNGTILIIVTLISTFAAGRSQ